MSARQAARHKSDTAKSATEETATKKRAAAKRGRQALAHQRSLFDAEPWYQQAAQPGTAEASPNASSPRANLSEFEMVDQQSLHLQAARRLSKAIRAQKADRRQQAKTGKAICEHLLALLAANESPEDPASHA